MDTTLLKGMKLSLTGQTETLHPLGAWAKDIHKQHDCEDALKVGLVNTEGMSDSHTLHVSHGSAQALVKHWWKLYEALGKEKHLFFWHNYNHSAVSVLG